MYVAQDTAYIAKNFRLALDTVSDKISKQFYKHAKKKVELWERATKTALSKRVSSQIIKTHARRPENSFPHLNSGHLRNSVRGDVHQRYTNKNATVGIVGSVGYVGATYEYEYASYTSHGYKKRKDGSTPQWQWWLDRVMLGYSSGDVFFNRVGNRVQSMSQIIDELISMRIDIKMSGVFK